MINTITKTSFTKQNKTKKPKKQTKKQETTKKQNKTLHEYSKLLFYSIKNLTKWVMKKKRKQKCQEKNDEKNNRKKNVIFCSLDHFNCSLCGHTTLPFSRSKKYPAEYSQNSQYLKPEQKKTKGKTQKIKIHNSIEVQEKNIEVQ